MAFYDNVIKYLAGFFRRLYRIRIIGEENIPQSDTPLLLCANHINNLDPVVIGAALKIKIYYMAKEELFHVPVLASVIRAFGAVPVKRGVGDVGAIKKTIEVLQEGKIAGIYPQGHRRPGIPPRGTELHAGAGMILWRTKADALPVCIRTKNRKLCMFRKTDIIVGKTISYTELPMTEGNSENYRAGTDYIFEQICQLDEADT